VRPLAYPLPFGQKSFHLQMIEDRLAVRIYTAQAGKITLFAGGNYTVQHDPVAAFTKIVFELYYKRQAGLTGENVSTPPELFQGIYLLSNAKAAENQIENVIGSRCAGNLVQCSQRVIKIEQQHLMWNIALNRCLRCIQRCD
jgi:hypothetical protein